MLRSLLTIAAVSIAAVAVVVRYRHDSQSKERLFNVEELSLYNGTDESFPILLAIIGSVFDVTKGKSHYGVGGGYHHFAGRDASRAFVSGNFTGDGLTDSLQGLSSTEVLGSVHDPNHISMFSEGPYKKFSHHPRMVKSVVDWRGFYLRTYRYAGKLVGRYYDSQGNPTKYLKSAEAKAAKGAQLLEKQKVEEAKQTSCNSKWSQQDGGEVWCDVGYPRLVQRPHEIALTGKMSKRCICLKEHELDEQGLELYIGCDYMTTACRV